MGGPVGDRAPGVPDHQLLVVSHGPKQGLVQQMPGHILHHCSVPSEDGLSVNDLVLFRSGIDVPQTDGVVIRGGEQVAVEVGVPGETVALLLVAPELEVWVTLACDWSVSKILDCDWSLAAGVGLAGVLRVVEHQDIGAGGLGGDHAGVLGHVPEH